jgi:SAM-dependent methyltransferase
MRLPPLAPNASLRYDTVVRELDRLAGVGGDLGEVLEIGCGQGAVGARLSLRARYTGVDLDETSLAVARRRLADAGAGGQVLCGWLTDVLPADATFDLVCAFEVLEHIRDDGAALREWRERVRPGGALMVSVPAHAARYDAADRMAGHFRRYDPAVLASALNASGFSGVRVRCYGMPLGFVLEKGRNVIAGRRGFAPTAVGIPSLATDSYGDGGGQPRTLDPKLTAELENNTRASGRLLQPGPGLAPFVQAATWPFRRLQHAFPEHGPGLVAVATRVD